VLVVPTGPLGNQGVDLGLVLAAALPRGEARIVEQILAADRLEEPPPVLGIGVAGEQIDEVVGPPGAYG
jgi:hypothetical protein